MKRCPQKKNRFPQKNWISLLNSAGIHQKTASVPAYNNLYHYAANNPVRYIDPDGRLLINNVSKGSVSAREYEKNHKLRNMAFLNYVLDSKGNTYIHSNRKYRYSPGKWFK